MRKLSLGVPVGDRMVVRASKLCLDSASHTEDAMISTIGVCATRYIDF